MILQLLSLSRTKVSVNVFRIIISSLRIVESSMHLFYVLITVLTVAQAVDQYPKPAVWNLFKRVHSKQYVNFKEEEYR